jgi:hypothetical protein
MPYALVPPVPDVTLHLVGRQPLLGEAHERHGHLALSHQCSSASLIRQLFNELLYLQDSDFSTDQNPDTVT